VCGVYVGFAIGMARAISPIMQTLIGSYSVQHPGFNCTAYLMAGSDGMTVHTITRGAVLYGKSRSIPVDARNALDTLKWQANSAPLF
jgi:hypothetical protein